MIDDLCLDTSYRNPLILQRCHSKAGNQQWLYDTKVLLTDDSSFMDHQCVRNSSGDENVKREREIALV